MWRRWVQRRNAGDLPRHGQGENDGELDPVRTRLLRLLAANGSNLRTASLAIGRNATYLLQFIKRGTPRVLAEDDREMLAEYLGCRPELLRNDRKVRLRARPKQPPPSSPLLRPEGLQRRAGGRCPVGGGDRSVERRFGGGK